MADQSNASSKVSEQVNFPDLSAITVGNLCDFLDHDMREAVKAHDLSLENLRVGVLEYLVYCLLDDGRKQFEIIHFIRMVIALWKHRLKVAPR